VAVSDVSDDVRRASVACLGLVCFRNPETVPKLVGLLAESFNPHMRYGACMAVGIACAGTLCRHLSHANPSSAGLIVSMHLVLWCVVCCVLVRHREQGIHRAVDADDRGRDRLRASGRPHRPGLGLAASQRRQVRTASHCISLCYRTVTDVTDGHEPSAGLRVSRSSARLACR
jgi:hypothetical protein